MPKSIQVYEHDKLSLGDQFQEHHRKALLKLNELHSFNYLEATYQGVKFKNYVGIVQIDGLCIEILPKIDNHNASKDQWKGVLIEMLRKTGKIKTTEANSADVQKRRYNLLEIYLDMFLREIELLLRRGLCKKYRSATTNTLALKGKLQMAGHIRQNLVHKERFYTTHQVYDEDHLLHQILKHTIDIVCRLTSSSYLSAKANRVLLSFPDLKTANISMHSFEHLTYDKKTSGYRKAIELARIIMGNYSPSISSGRTEMIALLFNMDNLWEEYVYQCLRKETQHREEIFISKKSKLPLLQHQRYRLEPDIVITINPNDDKNKKNFIIDTKWKVPKNQKANMQDLRQIYAYNHYWKASHGVLLYPGKKEDSNWMKYDDKTDTYHCKLLFLDIIDSQGKLNKDLCLISKLNLQNSTTL